MRYQAIEFVLQVVLLLCYLFAAAVLTVLGVLLEYRTLFVAASGDATLALWMSAGGLLAFGLAYLLVRDGFYPRLQLIRN